MKKQYNPWAFGLSLLVGLMIIGCEVRNPVSDETAFPSLFDLSAPDSVYLDTESSYAIRVNVEDPQGLADVTSVVLSVLDAGGQAFAETAMLDDGEHGDIIPQDGVYFALLNPSIFSGNSGRFEIRVIATDAAGHTSDPAQDSIYVIQGVPNGSPILSDAVFPSQLTNESVRSVYFEVTVFDPQGANDVESVWCDAYLPFAVVPFYKFYLNDRGEDGDSTGGDGRFAIRDDLGQTFQSTGEYTLRFQAKDRAGFKSRPITGIVSVIRTNEPPVLSNPGAPNQVSLDEIVLIRITIQVSDPQGPGDIKRVYFNSFKPDGTASSGNPFLMFDDGTQGDIDAGDGTYSLMIQITAQNALGVYRFDFYAEDLAGLISDVIHHEIEVTE